MEAGTVTQLITVGGTLGGVILTLVTSAYLEGRRARDARALEELRLGTERAKWLREERVGAYVALSMAGEEALQFIRTEMPALVEPGGAERRNHADARWHQLRIELRKAYNQVALFGGDEARTAARQVWRTAHDGGNDLLGNFGAGPDRSHRSDLSERVRDVVSRLGTVGDRFLETCRHDLQA